jgi:hypothetical protein
MVPPKALGGANRQKERPIPSHDAKAGGRAQVAAIYAIAAWSGFYVMLVELLGGRLIAPFFGSSIYVWGSVIFVFMFGLSLGYLFGGLYSKNATLIRLCGLLALAAVSSLPIVLFGDPLLNALFDALPDPRAGSLASCLALFLVPSIFSGMVSPVAIRLLVGDQSSSGRRAGFLYFASTVGSSVGTLLTSFYLVLWFEVNTIILAGVGVSLAVGALCTVLNLRRTAS